MFRMDLLKIIEEDFAEIKYILSNYYCYKELADLYTQLAKLKSLAIKCGYEKVNGHYSYCCWSNINTECGPDTCPCVTISFIFHDLKQKLQKKIILCN